MPVRSEEELANVLAKIEPLKIGALFYRTVPFKYRNGVDSIVGAVEHGGRFNPPLHLARSECNLPDGLGFLYTATNPITCLFECGHILRGGLQAGEFQILPVEPTLLVSFKVEADCVLDLRNVVNQELLGESDLSLSAIDPRAVVNARGSLTQLQNLGVAVCKTARFAGILTTSRFFDMIPSFCFSFLPERVRCEVQDSSGLLKQP